MGQVSPHVFTRDNIIAGVEQLRFTFTNADLDTTIVGTANPAHLHDNVAICKKKTAAGRAVCRCQGGSPTLARCQPVHDRLPVMSGNGASSLTRNAIRVEHPRLHKVILVNDDHTPREFVVIVLKAAFLRNEDQAMRVMTAAHRRGACVVAETKAKNATDAGRSKGYPLLFTTEPDE